MRRAALREGEKTGALKVEHKKLQKLKEFKPYKIVSLLVESRVDIHLRNYHGQTALMQACQHGHWEVVLFLILFGANEFDLVVRFCKDVETRGQTGYVDIGRFDPLSYFVSSSGNFDFVQGFYHGDLSNCEQSYDKLGRTSQVNIICGNCSDGRCGLGCICSVTQDSTCRVTDDLAIPCEKPGPLVFKGFKFSSRSDQQSSRWINHTSSCGGFERTHRDGAVTLGFGRFGYSGSSKVLRIKESLLEPGRMCLVMCSPAASWSGSVNAFDALLLFSVDRLYYWVAAWFVFGPCCMSAIAQKAKGSPEA
ncbi:Ankyrin repeat-containing domain superfamily [Arabidopsis suecica]|uniref:Ankyrin repeat-containing domain superfamily n=1 Tax=Arabidopsis suecica TaxID=45249 RepID=A0A8T1ZC26_ARASU|nr:Ankyrin repeat-containing domain superfamily [Arabidopsis suecica]